jgi:hypothetical protein
MTFNERMAEFRRAKSGPGNVTTYTIRMAIARYLAMLVPRPDGVMMVSEVVAGVRRMVRPKQRRKVKRCEVVEGLQSMGVPIGLQDKRQCVVGFSSDPAPTLAVDETTGRIVEAA